MLKFPFIPGVCLVLVGAGLSGCGFLSGQAASTEQTEKKQLEIKTVQSDPKLTAAQKQAAAKAIAERVNTPILRKVPTTETEKKEQEISEVWSNQNLTAAQKQAAAKAIVERVNIPPKP